MYLSCYFIYQNMGPIEPAQRTNTNIQMDKIALVRLVRELRHEIDAG